MDGITFRQIPAAELDAAARFRHAMTLEMSGADLDLQYPGWLHRYVDFFRHLIDAGQAAVLFAEAGGQPIGMAAAYLPTTHRTVMTTRPLAYLTNIYVMPSYRRLGIGARLTQLAIEWARANNCVVVRLRASAMGRPLYERLGFRASEEMELQLAP